MTIDAALIKHEGYKSRLFEEVCRVAEHEYIRLALQRGIVYRDELLGSSWESLYIQYRERLLEEAFERGDHLMYGMSRIDFIDKFYDQDSPDVGMNPYIRQQDYRDAFEVFLAQFQLMVHEHGAVEHSVLQEVW